MPLCSCEICDNVFTSTHIDAMYCSVLCRNKARYTKHKAKYREKVIRVYGITGIIYEQMLEQQEFVCAICKQEEKAINPNTGYPFPLSIDHNHKTNKVRDFSGSSYRRSFCRKETLKQQLHQWRTSLSYARHPRL